jgi:hypothetical protein
MPNPIKKASKTVAKVSGLGKKEVKRKGGKAAKPLTKKQQAAKKKSEDFQKRVAANKKKKEIERLKVIGRKVERKKIKKNKERDKGKISAAPTTGRAGDYARGQLRAGRKGTEDGRAPLAADNLDLELKERGGSGNVQTGRGGGKINVGTEVSMPKSLTNRGPKRKAEIAEANRIESKIDSGEKLTQVEKLFIRNYDNKEAMISMKQQREVVPANSRMIGFEEPKKPIDRELMAKQKKARLAEEKRVAAKKKKNMMRGGMATKSNKGHMDFRKGGLILSSVDNRKKKK